MDDWAVPIRPSVMKMRYEDRTVATSAKKSIAVETALCNHMLLMLRQVFAFPGV